MSSSRRIFLSFLVGAALTGCGFTPVYRKDSAANDLHGNLEFNLIESAEGFLLLEKLEGRFGSPVSARFSVSVELMIEEEELVLTATTAVIRYTLDGIAKITVTDSLTGESVFSDRLRDTAGYTGTSETLVTKVSEKDARYRLVTALADKIILRLTSTAESWAV